MTVCAAVRRIAIALAILAGSMLPGQESGPAHAELASAPASAAARPDASPKVAGLRMPFIANEGQADPRVAYYAPTFAGTLFVTARGELVYALPPAGAGARRSRRDHAAKSGWTLVETLEGGTVRPAGHDRTAAGVSYFRGPQAARTRGPASTYAQVSLGEVWPGVVVALQARGRTIEKVFTVQPGASVERIRLRVGGAETLSLDREGALTAGTGLGPVTFTAPVAYQERDGVRRPVSVGYWLDGRAYGFTVGAHDRSLPLVIDPLLQSTYLGGGADDFGRALAIHPASGEVYIAGSTEATDFPGVAGGAQSGGGSSRDAFVARLNPTLTALTQATYLGGSAADSAFALAIHPTSGDVYVAGLTGSADFPGTLGGAQPTFGGVQDAFVTRLNAALTDLVQTTYLGGSDSDDAFGLGIHPATGDVYVTGATRSVNFPGTSGGAQPVKGGLGNNEDGYVARLNASLTTLHRATYLGGSANDEPNALGIHPATGDIYVTGLTYSADFPKTAGGAQPALGPGPSNPPDAFVARLDPALTAITQATYAGGSESDIGYALAFHPTTGDVYVAGETASVDFPMTAGGAQPGASASFTDSVVARLNSVLTALLQATYLGGESPGSFIPTTGALAIAVHPVTGDVYVGGSTTATIFPGTGGGAQATKSGGFDGFVARLDGGLTALTQATFLGGFFADDVFALAVHPATGDVYAVGSTNSADFPGTVGGAQPAKADTTSFSDAFVARFTRSLAAPTFIDVTSAHPFLPWIEALFAAGITSGCAPSPPQYCPGDGVTRAQMAVFLLRGAHGRGFEPPAATGTLFDDVAATRSFAAWIEELAHEGITSGCSGAPPLYCPDAVVTRAQMAVFLLRARHGADHRPPAATGTMFDDVPSTHPQAAWIEELAREGITGGCSAAPPRYCPDAGVTRGQMAVFLVRAFSLPL